MELWRAEKCTEIERFRAASDKSVISKITRYIPRRGEAKFLERPLKIPAFSLVRQSRRDSAIRSRFRCIVIAATKWCAMIKGPRFEKSALVKAQRWSETPLKRIEVLVAHLNVKIRLLSNKEEKRNTNEQPSLMRRHINTRHLPSQCNEIINVIK